MADSPEEIKKAARTYLFVFLLLLIGTVLTVLVATWYPLEKLFGGHGFDVVDMIVGLAIATTKATLVALIFMHLNHEKKAVYWIFGSGIVFAAWMGALIALAKNDPIYDPFFYSGSAAAVESAGSVGSD
jgi:caa(3)-type oxidase subunit IV